MPAYLTHILRKQLPRLTASEDRLDVCLSLASNVTLGFELHGTVKEMITHFNKVHGKRTIEKEIRNFIVNRGV